MKRLSDGGEVGLQQLYFITTARQSDLALVGELFAALLISSE